MIRQIGLAAATLVTSAAAPPAVPGGDAARYIAQDLHLTRYKAAQVDLNRDGTSEILVYATDPQHCGSGGCDLYVLAQSRGRYRVVSGISVARLPIRLLAGSSHGWRDLGVQVAGGGITRGYQARLRYDGRTYPRNPTVAPALPLAGVTGRIVLR